MATWSVEGLWWDLVLKVQARQCEVKNLGLRHCKMLRKRRTFTAHRSYACSRRRERCTSTRVLLQAPPGTRSTIEEEHPAEEQLATLGTQAVEHTAPPQPELPEVSEIRKPRGSGGGSKPAGTPAGKKPRVVVASTRVRFDDHAPRTCDAQPPPSCGVVSGPWGVV